MKKSLSQKMKSPKRERKEGNGEKEKETCRGGEGVR
jgi:hypothetical protein